MEKTTTLTLLLMVLLLFLGCSSTKETDTAYKTLSAEEAKNLMEETESYLLLDVRTPEEYDAGHIEGALLKPLDTLESVAEEAFPDKDQMILIYCRSGNRSATAAKLLQEMGYTDVYDFGGIIDWPYEVVK
ncbi:rhodanese-like domain-containing protein [Fusibacter sp. JL298sf-3]